MKFTITILALLAIVLTVWVFVSRLSDNQEMTTQEVIRSVQEQNLDSDQSDMLWRDLAIRSLEMSEAEQFMVAKQLMRSTIVDINAESTDENQGWISLEIRCDPLVNSALVLDVDEVKLIFADGASVNVQTDTRSMEFAVYSDFSFVMQLSPHQILPEQRANIQSGAFRMVGVVTYLRDPSITLPWPVDVEIE